jgi:hypothetical protein
VFKFLKKSDTIYDQLDSIYPPAFTGIHSSDLSLTTLSALYVPLMQYNIELNKLIYVIDNQKKLSPFNYRHTSIITPVSDFFLTKDHHYGQEITSLEIFKDLARRYLMQYDQLNQHITDTSDMNSQLLLLSKVTADLNQLIYSLVAINQLL